MIAATSNLGLTITATVVAGMALATQSAACPECGTR